MASHHFHQRGRGKSKFDNPATVPTLSERGLDVGAPDSTVSAWLEQRHRERREVVSTKMARLEQLYSQFINESARLLVDAVPHSLDKPGMLVPLYPLLSRIVAPVRECLG